MNPADVLRTMSDTDLAAVVAELEDRADLFDTKTRSFINDELRRRRMPTVEGKRW